MKRARKRIVLLLVLATLVAAAFASVSFRTAPVTIKLSDGSTIAVLKTSYGRTSHRMMRGGLWNTILYGWVPNEWLDMCRVWSWGGTTGVGPAGTSVRQRIAMRAMKHISAAYTTTNALVVWFNQSQAATNTALPNLRVLPVDADGDVWAAPFTMPDSFSQSGSQSGATADRRFYFSYPAFPRREREVRLRVFAQRGTNWEHAGEFKIPNPAWQNYPHWTTPSSLPTVSHEGYEFALTNFLSGVDSLHFPIKRIATGEIGSLMAGFRFTRAGKSSDAWSVVGLEAEDATGNRWQSLGYSRSGSFQIATGGRVPTNEAVKVRATFSREGDFDTNALWHIRGVPMPPPGSFLLFTNYFTNLNGVRISLVGVSPGGVNIPNSGIGSSAPLVHFKVEPRQPDWRISLVSVTDETGKPLPPPADRRPVFSANIACQFNYQSGMKSADFVVALNKPVTVEFMAKATTP